MRDKARYIIDTIERLARVTKGGKRAHSKGFNYKGEVKLNDLGRALIGDSNDAVVRLSDALTDQQHSTRLIPLKGMAIRFNGDHPANIILVTFPYFPWNKADSIVKLAQYSQAIHDASDIKVKLNLVRYMSKIEGFNQHLVKFLIHQPVIPTFKGKVFHNLHYFKHEDHYVRFQAELIGRRIALKAEIHSRPKPLDVIPKDFELVDIGSIELTTPIEEVIEKFDVLATGPYLTPSNDDEIIQLRSALYDVSHESRMREGLRHDKVQDILDMK